MFDLSFVDFIQSLLFVVLTSKDFFNRVSEPRLIALTTPYIKSCNGRALEAISIARGISLKLNPKLIKRVDRKNFMKNAV